ncbi:MAG: FAD-binding oxidoreductase [Jatrophihabitans sp.]
MVDPAPSHGRNRVGGLVLGQTERRQSPAATPAFYAPSAEPYDRSTVRTAWDLVSDRADALIRMFYAELFLALGDDAFAMFPASMTQQRADFGRALVQWVVTDDPDSMSVHLAQLGADHRKFDVEPQHYDLVGSSLIRAWRGLLGDAWTEDFTSAVTASYTRLASIMIDGAQEHRAEPASWGATVLEHTRALDNFAVLRLQPDQQYPFQAGQYLTLELASRSREWRQMSIASAPRPDNTLELQVRSVNATGVSAALVRHTAVGDRLRLGPPRGNDLVVDPGTLPPGGLLCVCAGTGAAPISAVVEAASAWPGAPPIYVFVGARTAADLYPARRLRRAVDEGGHSDHVQVYGVVSDDAEYTGLRGRVEDVVPTLKDWAQVDVAVLVAGPDPMIAATVRGLTDAGVATARIHFDQYDVSG